MGRNKITTPQDQEAFDLDFVKTHLRVDFDIQDEDDLISQIISVSRDHVEKVTNRIITPETNELTLDGFPFVNTPIELPKMPVTAVNSIQYIDEDDALQTWDAANYIVDSTSDNDFTRITPIETESYPVTANRIATITINYDVGYAEVKDIPVSILQAMLLIIGDLYENRQDALPQELFNIPMGAAALLSSYRIASF